MTIGNRVMLLVDADNVSADVVDQAVDQVLRQHGAIHVRRAYCTAESALANLKLFKAHSIRPIVNLSTGKNSTDIALAVDAVDLVIAERPGVVVIVSSDSDFAPLVIKLREKGCRVEGIGQQGKTGDDSKPVYDAFTDIAHRKSRPSAAPRKRAAAVAAARQPQRGEPEQAATASVDAGEPPAAPATDTASPRATPRPSGSPTALDAAPRPARQRGRRKDSSAAVAPTAEPAAAMPDDLRRILAVLPELARGSTLELGIAAERLRSENLLAKNAPSTKLFRKYPDWFTLTPDRQPNKVQYRKPG